ncbi:MAG: BrnA antitoxin family protein [Betaproteobacteria bacterium]|nr:BrnA antitoxin family protein [Betaproteobacteria bacterium]
MSKSSNKTPIQMPSVAEDRKITAAAKADPEARPLTNAQLAQMVPAKALRGRPPLATTKQLVSVRYSPEVLAYFRSTGEGWQARMDGVLKRYVESQSRRRLRGNA